LKLWSVVVLEDLFWLAIILCAASSKCGRFAGRWVCGCETSGVGVTWQVNLQYLRGYDAPTIQKPRRVRLYWLCWCTMSWARRYYTFTPPPKTSVRKTATQDKGNYQLYISQDTAARDWPSDDRRVLRKSDEKP